MRTLPLRVAAASANAQAIAERLAGHPRLSHVLYPGLANHPGHAVAVKQMRGGFGGMMSLRLKGGEAAAIQRAVLFAHDVRKRFGRNEALRGVDLVVMPGEVVALWN